MAQRRHPERWARSPRQWERVEVVKLNPETRIGETNNLQKQAA